MPGPTWSLLAAPRSDFSDFWASRKASKIHVFFASLQKAKKSIINGPRSVPEPFWERFSLEGPSANLSPKMRFLTDFGSQLGSKIVPWNTIFDQKGSKRVVGFRARRIMEPTWARFGTENAPRMHFHRSGVVFWSILKGFWKDFEQFWIDVWLFLQIFFSPLSTSVVLAF